MAMETIDEEAEKLLSNFWGVYFIKHLKIVDYCYGSYQDKHNLWEEHLIMELEFYNKYTASFLT